jgi:hypothetical protein
MPSISITEMTKFNGYLLDPHIAFLSQCAIPDDAEWSALHNPLFRAKSAGVAKHRALDFSELFHMFSSSSYFYLFLPIRFSDEDFTFSATGRSILSFFPTSQVCV